MVVFDWDNRKKAFNKKKHGISFEEAVSVFLDDDARIMDDPDHSNGDEERFVLIGLSEHLRILTVVHCYRDKDKVIRIISARKATKNEKRIFGEYKNA